MSSQRSGSKPRASHLQCILPIVRILHNPLDELARLMDLNGSELVDRTLRKVVLQRSAEDGEGWVLGASEQDVVFVAEPVDEVSMLSVFI